MTEAERIIWVLLVVSAWLALCWYFVRRPQSTSLATAIVGEAEQPGLLIAYASQSGSAAALAQCCLQLLGGASVARLLPLNQVTDDILSSSRRALFVASTYGEGEPPDNGIAFARRLAAAPAAGYGGLDLTELEFAVIALGDRSYQRFCAFGHQLHAGMMRLGARALQAPAEIDKEQLDQHDSSGLLSPWLSAWWPVAAPVTGAAMPLAAKASTHLWQLERRQLLNSGSPGQSLWRLHLRTSDALPPWRAGDILQVRPRHSLARVHTWLRQHGLDSECWLELSGTRQTLAQWLLDRQLPAAGVPVPFNVGGAPTSESTAELAAIGEWLTRLPRLPLRDYSIASVPDEGELQLLVRQQSYTTAEGVIECGLGSGWLTAVATAGDVIEASIRSNPAFHCDQPQRPLLLIGSGSGLAGLRAHLAERANQSPAAAPVWLIFGERDPVADLLLDDELGYWHALQVLQRCDRTFSRAPVASTAVTTSTTTALTATSASAHRYVQDCLRAEARRVRQWIADGALIYVCGSQSGMGRDVHAALRDILGDKKLNKLQEAGDYRRDLF